MYSDTLFALTISRKGERCAPFFAIAFGWSCAFPLKLKSDAHEALSSLYEQDGVPPVIKDNSAKEMILGDFNRELKETLCHLRQTEPFTPWSNEAEQEIKELKKGSGRKLTNSGTQKRL